MSLVDSVISTCYQTRSHFSPRTLINNRFRLAVCQLDELSKCVSRKDVRNALRDLPGTLNEIYDMMLGSIDSRHVNRARRVLHWLAHTKSLSLPELAEAVAYDIDEEGTF